MKLKKINRLHYILKIFLKYGLEELIKKKFFYFCIIIIKYIFFRKIKKNKEKNLGVRIRQTLETLGPVWIKFGQMLSTRLDLLPRYISNQLSLLQDNVKPFKGSQALNTVEKALNSPIEKYFKNFKLKPLASASISQVHTATLKENNKSVVIKIIRPNISKIIIEDIDLIFFLVKLLNFSFKKIQRFRILEIIENYKKDLLNETNLLIESKNTIKLRKNFKNSDLLYIPKIYLKFCRKNIMVIERIRGIPISNITSLKKHGINIKKLAERGIQIFFTQVLRDSFFHADMHPGNIFVELKNTEKPRYIGIDCGIVGFLNKDDKRYITENFIAFFNRDYRKIAELHIDSGWVSPNTNILEFELDIYNVCEPIFNKPLKEISFFDVLLKLFSTAEKFDMQIQPQLILLQKTLFYVEGIGRNLYPKLDLWKTAKPFLEKWIKNQYSIYSVVKNIKNNIPFFIKTFPEIPENILNNIRFLKKIKYSIEELSNNIKYNNKQKKNYFIFFVIIIMMILITILFFYSGFNFLLKLIMICNILFLFFNLLK